MAHSGIAACCPAGAMALAWIPAGFEFDVSSRPDTLLLCLGLMAVLGPIVLLIAQAVADRRNAAADERRRRDEDRWRSDGT